MHDPLALSIEVIHRHLSKKMNPSQTGQNASCNTGNTSTHFYKLPYVGRFSKIAQTELRQLIKRYCCCKADLDVKLVFSTFKLRNMFSVKDSVPQGLRSRVVYKFSCAGCNASYIGEWSTFVHVFVSTSCQTSLRMFTDTCSHLGPVMTLVIQNVSRSQILPPQNSKFRSKRHCTLRGKIPFS